MIKDLPQFSHFFLQDCLLGSARCVLFQCPLHRFSGQAVLKIHARLWNSSFIEVSQEFECAVLSAHFFAQRIYKL